MEISVFMVETAAVSLLSVLDFTSAITGKMVAIYA